MSISYNNYMTLMTSTFGAVIRCATSLTGPRTPATVGKLQRKLKFKIDHHVGTRFLPSDPIRLPDDIVHTTRHQYSRYCNHFINNHTRL